MLHVGDPNSTTKCRKIQPLLDLLCPAFESVYTLDRHIAIDESVITFWGRVTIWQYLKDKPNTWGIKAYILVDKSGYLYRVHAYWYARPDTNPKGCSNPG